jgi:hypothetical protein
LGHASLRRSGGLGFAVADYAGHEQIAIVECGW